jgi:hypothetical protein
VGLYFTIPTISSLLSPNKKRARMIARARAVCGSAATTVTTDVVLPTRSLILTENWGKAASCCYFNNFQDVGFAGLSCYGGSGKTRYGRVFLVVTPNYALVASALQ